MADAFAVRGLLRERWGGLVLPAFEKACDEAVDAGVVVRIPRIEVRLKIRSVEDLAQALPEQIGHLFQEEIELALPKSRRSQSKTGLPATRRSREEHAFEQLIRYLRTGLLDWDASGEPADATAASLAAAFRHKPETLRRWMAEAPEGASFHVRLIQLLGEDGAATLMESVLEGLGQGWGRAAALVVGILVRPGIRNLGGIVRRRLAAVFLAECIERRAQAVAPDFSVLAVDAMPELDWRAFAEFVALLPEDSRALFRPDEHDGVFFRAGGPFPGQGQSRLRGAPPRYANGRDSHADEARAPKTGNPMTPRPGGDADATAESFPLVVNLAGLILLHPFLSRLFENVGIFNHGEPRLPERVLGRAAALLHWLATGRADVHEFELGFAKVLMGLSPDEPIDASGDCLEAGDREEGDVMLKSVIGHWPALKSTSVGGLRATFLDRHGYLRGQDDGWSLEVERRGFDVLLDRLPWTIGSVRLPWSSHPISTKW